MLIVYSRWIQEKNQQPKKHTKQNLNKIKSNINTELHAFARFYMWLDARLKHNWTQCAGKFAVDFHYVMISFHLYWFTRDGETLFCVFTSLSLLFRFAVCVVFVVLARLWHRALCAVLCAVQSIAWHGIGSRQICTNRFGMFTVILYMAKTAQQHNKTRQATI